MKNMLANKYILNIFFVFLFVACGKKELLPQDYSSWVKDYSNGIHKKREVSKIVFDVQHKPSDFIILNEKGGAVDKSIFLKRTQELQGLQYYTLKINIAGDKQDFLKYGIQSEKEYYDKLYYYSFNFQKDIYLEQGEKIFPCKFFHFERSYDLTASRTFIIAFENTDNTADKTLVINSKDLGLGPVKINFAKEDLNLIPQLKI